MNAGTAAPVARLAGVGHAYGATRALDGIDLVLPKGGVIGLIGPDGVGKSSLLSLIGGATRVQRGRVEVLGGDMARQGHRTAVCQRIAFMPQGLGRNLYPTLSVYENVDFFGRLFGLGAAARRQRIAALLEHTRLAPVADRPAGKLSGGMKQKLGLCCALIHDPDLLILDEPTTGVDPLSRRQFWELIAAIRAGRPGMTVLVATAYMEEAERFDWLVAMNAGRVIATGTADALRAQTATGTLDDAFIALLPEAARAGHRNVAIPPRDDGAEEVTIAAERLTMRFGDFVAVRDVSFRIGRGEIFGFLGSNGCGKTTTMKMLTGLLPASEGRALLFGHAVDPHDLATRSRVGYMSQSFSLYTELSVRQNLELHARLFRLPGGTIAGRIAEVARDFELGAVMEAMPDALPPGVRQRMSLAVAMVHRPDMLILDEPTSGVDPVARDQLWRILARLSRENRVTIFVSTHFMNEAARCDRIALMHAGRVLVTGAPAQVVADAGAATLEEAFIAHLREASGETAETTAVGAWVMTEQTAPVTPRRFDPRRLASYARRESLELRRDPIRLTLAVFGSLILMFVLAAGMSLDVEDLRFAVLDRDQTVASANYALDIAGSRYFIEEPPLADYADLDRRMRAGQISLAIEIPAGFGRDARRALEGRGPGAQIAAWVDGAMPQRAETVTTYLQGVHAHWLATQAQALTGGGGSTMPFSIETRYRYNPDVRSVVAMVPAVIALLLMMIPAMLAAISVVREKELGSIVNFYVTPVTRLEFLIGKQLPYVGLGMINCVLLLMLGVFGFGVPFNGSLAAFLAGGLLYVAAATAIGLLASSFMRSQIAAIFGTAVLTLLPAISLSGMIDPVSSLVGFGRLVGEVFPTSYFLVVARGTFSKALGFAQLQPALLPLLAAAPVLVAASAALLKKQAR